MNAVFLLLGDSPASEFYMPTFRTLCLFHLHRRCKQDGIFLLTPLLSDTTYEDGTHSVSKRRHMQFTRQGITQKKEYNTFPLPFQFPIHYSSISWPYVVWFADCFLWRCDPTRAMASSFLRFLEHTQRRTTVGRTPLDEWSSRRRDLYLTTHNTHNRQTSMPSVGFEPTISASERPQTYALDRAATGIGTYRQYPYIFSLTN